MWTPQKSKASILDSVSRKPDGTRLDFLRAARCFLKKLDEHRRLLELELENAELKREIERLRAANSLLESRLELNLQNVRYLMLHGGVSH